MVMQSHYTTAVAALAELGPTTISNTRTVEDLLIAHLIFKCVVKMACWVWPRLGGKDPVASRLEGWVSRALLSPTHLYSYNIQFLELFRNSALQLQTLSELRINLVLAIRSGAASATPVTEQSIKTLTRHIRLFGKNFRRLQQLDAVKFVKLPSCSDLILYYWSKVVQATNSPNDHVQGKLEMYEMRALPDDRPR